MIVEQLKKIRRLYPYEIFLADDGETWLVSTLTLPQHPVCSCGKSPDYARAICTALNVIGLAMKGF